MQTNWVVRCALVAAAAIVIVQMAGGPVGAQEDIGGREAITEAEIEQRTKFNELTGKPASRDQVVDELREEKRKIREGRRWGLEASDQEVDIAYAQMARRMGRTAEQLTEILAQKGIDAATLKHRIRADIASQRMLRRSRFEQPKPKWLRGPPGDHWT